MSNVDIAVKLIAEDILSYLISAPGSEESQLMHIGCLPVYENIVESKVQDEIDQLLSNERGAVLRVLIAIGAKETQRENRLPIHDDDYATAQVWQRQSTLDIQEVVRKRRWGPLFDLFRGDATRPLRV
jgi:hypothetical protein